MGTEAIYMRAADQRMIREPSEKISSSLRNWEA